MIKASLLRAHAFDHDYKAIMGSNIDVLYKVKVTAVLKKGPDAYIEVRDELWLENPGQICEFYRPWNPAKSNNSNEHDAKKLVLVSRSGAWTVVGGEQGRK